MMKIQLATKLAQIAFAQFSAQAKFCRTSAIVKASE
jgi:hypothetical protein